MLGLKRMISLALAATMLCGTLAGCAGSDSGKPTLTVYNWGDYIGEDVIENARGTARKLWAASDRIGGATGIELG